MKNNQKSLRKVIMLFIIVLIPLLAATFIGVYGYNRYQDDYFYNYMRETEEDTETKINSYLRYTNYLYEEEPYFTEDITKDGEHVLTFSIYRGTQDNENDELYYYFVLYNIDYEKIIEIEDPTGEKKLLYNNIPGIYLTIKSKDNAEDETTEMFGSISDDMVIDDYESSPTKDSKGKELNSRFVKWIAFKADKKYSEDIDIKLLVSRDINDENARKSTIKEFELNNFENDYEDLDTDMFVEGYDNDIAKAGYFGYVFKTKIWWQSLIAFILIGLISLSFYAVWTAEENQAKGKK